MTIWARLSGFVADTASSAFGGLVEAVRTVFAGDPATRRRVAFSIAMVALSAKMAKADGVVTPEEVEAFEQIFEIAPEDHHQVERLYNLAKQDVAGYRSYAEQLADLCGSGQEDCPMLRDILDGLFHIAKADGVVHEKEYAFLADVATIFQLSNSEFDRMTARHVDKGDSDPYRILGITTQTSYEDARAIYRSLVRENHPDGMIARDVPEEFLKIAHDRISAINTAWETVEPELRRT